MIKLFVFLLFLSTIFADHYYVSPNPTNPDFDCLTPATPCNGILAALALADAGDTLYLLAGVFSGSLNVPFQINQTSLSMRGESAGVVTIDCGKIYPYCAQVYVADKVVFSNIIFSNYQPYDQQELLNLPHDPSDGPFQSLLSVQSQFQQNQHFDWPPPRFNLEIIDCQFINNIAPQSPNWNGASLVYVYKLFPNTWLDITSTTFSNNSVSCINAMYSNVNITNSYFSNNTGTDMGTILSAAVHPWVGGAQVAIYDTTFDSITEDSHMFILDGTFCSSRLSGSALCYPFIFNYNTINSQAGRSPIFILVNGAQLDMKSTTISLASDRPIIVSQTGTSRVSIPAQVTIVDSIFNGTNGNQIAVDGYFTDSSISSSQFNQIQALKATGEISISSTTFNSQKTMIQFNTGTCYIKTSSFTGDGSNSISIDTGLESVANNSRSATTIILSQTTINNALVAVNESSFFYFDQSALVFSSGPVFVCEEEDASHPSIVNFIGLTSTSSSKDIVNDDSSCLFVCNNANEDICGSDNDIQLVQDNSRLNGWQIVLIISFCLITAWASIVTIIMLLIAYYFFRNRTQYTAIDELGDE